MESVAAYIQNNPSLAVLAVFLGGLISSASPCVLALVPLVIGYVGGYSQGDKKKAIKYSVTFAFGLSLAFTLMGAAAGFVGSIISATGAVFYIIVAAIAIIMGLSLMGVFDISLPFRSKIQPKASGLIGSFLMGGLFGFVSTPCATPVLVVILAFVAVKGQILYGVFLLFIYSLAHCALLVLAGIATGFVEAFGNSRIALNFSLWTKKISGALIVLAGLYILYINLL
jgi:cytochrome c-type biogenesis protein